MKKHKIVFLATRQWQINELWEPMAKHLAKNYNFDVYVRLHRELDRSAMQELLRDCEALITTWGAPRCSADFLKKFAPGLQIIGHAAGSVASIADESTYDTGVKIISANPVMAHGVAEWSLLATLLALRNFGAYTAWHGMNKMCYPKASQMIDIRNATIGIWGMGDTTRHLLRMLAPLQPDRIMVASQHSSKSKIAEFGAEKADFETVLKNSDVFHALVGVNKSNFERLGAEEFAMLKDGATLVNCGRARLTNEAALMDVLRSKRINAILDVFHAEPLPDDSPLYELDNLILTPHNAGFPGRERFIPYLFEEFSKYFDGIAVQSAISKERFLSMTDEALAFS